MEINDTIEVSKSQMMKNFMYLKDQFWIDHEANNQKYLQTSKQHKSLIRYTFQEDSSDFSVQSGYISGRETEGQAEAGVQEKDNDSLEQISIDGLMKYLDENQ